MPAIYNFTHSGNPWSSRKADCYDSDMELAFTPMLSSHLSPLNSAVGDYVRHLGIFYTIELRVSPGHDTGAPACMWLPRN
jgi:hypothetical protein